MTVQTLTSTVWRSTGLKRAAGVPAPESEPDGATAWRCRHGEPVESGQRRASVIDPLVALIDTSVLWTVSSQFRHWPYALCTLARDT